LRQKKTLGFIVALTAGMISMWVVGAAIIDDKTDSRPDCASFYTGQTFEGGIVSPAYRVTRIRADEEEIEVFYVNLGYFGKIRCNP
jgi:hypothetical protein